MPDAKRPLKVFLCHAHEDSDSARALYSRLVNCDINAWLDEEKLLPGQNFDLEIGKAIRSADVIVILLSRKSVNKEGYIQKEIRRAIEIAEEKPEENIFIIPARLDSCDVPNRLSHLHWVDLFVQNSFKRLTNALALRAEQIGVMPPICPPEPVRERIPGRRETYRKLSPPIVIALIALAGIITAAVIGSSAFLFVLRRPPTPDIIITSTATNITTTGLTETFTPPVVLTPRPDSQIFMSLLDSFAAPGIEAEGITWDGTFLWVSDNSGTIFKMDSSGKVLDSIASPEVTPQGMTWDGSTFWVFTTNYFFIYQFQVMDGKAQTVSSFLSPAEVVGGGLTQDMAWDGENLWYANQFNVYKLDTSGNVLGLFTFPENVSGLDWDGSNLWLASNEFPESATLTIVNTTGEVIDAFPSPVYEINGLAWAGDYLWVLGRDSVGGAPMIYKIGVLRE